MGRIFICYRREDTADAAGRIADRLINRFGAKKVFFDVEGIKPGVDFVSSIESEVASSPVIIVVIGKEWLNVKDSSGRPKIESPEDYVHSEIQAALKCGVPIIPVLINGATLPRPGQLPSSLSDLLRKQALEINHTAFPYGVNELIRAIENFEKERSEQNKQQRTRKRKLSVVMFLVLALTVLSGVAVRLWSDRVRSEHIAQAGRLLSFANRIVREEPAKFDEAALLAIESLKLDSKADATSILREAVARLPQRLAESHVQCDGKLTITVGGHFLLCVDKHNQSRIVAVRDGNNLAQFSFKEASEIVAADLSPDRKFLGFGLRDGGARLFNIQSENLVLKQDAASEAVVAFSEYTRYFATAVFDGSPGYTIRVFFADDNAKEFRRFQIEQRVLGLRFSSDGRFLAVLHSASSSTEVSIFDVIRGTKSVVRAGAALPTFALSDGAALIAFPGLDNAVHIRATTSDEIESGNLQHQQPVKAVAITSDGKYAASGSEDGTVRVIETGTDRALALIPIGSIVKELAFDASNKLVVISADNIVRIFNVLERAALEALNVRGTIAISPTGRYLTTFGGASNSKLAIVERRSGKEFRIPINLQSLDPRDTRYSLDEELFVVADRMLGMFAYELKTGKTYQRPAVAGILARAISADGKVSGWATEERITVFPIDDANQATTLEFPKTYAFEIGAGGKLVFAADRAGRSAVFDMTTKNKLLDVSADSLVSTATFSPDGTFLGVALEDRSLLVFNLQTKQIVLRLKNKTAISSLVFSRTNKFLATTTGGPDQSSSSFDVIEPTTGQSLFQISRDVLPLSVAFTENDRHVDVVDETFLTRQYLRTEDLVEESCRLLTRNLRPAEWNAVMPGKAYLPTCPNITDQ